MKKRFVTPIPLTLREIVEVSGISSWGDADPDSLTFRGVADLKSAEVGDLSFLENPHYLADLEATHASACFVSPHFSDKTPKNVFPLITKTPYRAYALAASAFFPSLMRPVAALSDAGISAHAHVHPEALLGKNVLADVGAIICAGAEIGDGAFIGAGAFIGPGVKIGRLSSIGQGVTVQFSYIGDRVIIHPGVRIGQDGFGFSLGESHLKLPHFGKVVIEDDVEIGANTTVDRGSVRDTFIGAGTKIDNLVQIAHNVTIGRHCVFAGQVGIAGSATLEDYVILGGIAGVAGHITIGKGVQIAASSQAMRSASSGERLAGAPAKRATTHWRELATLVKLSREKS